MTLAGEEAVALGLQEHVCWLSLLMGGLARLKVRVQSERRNVSRGRPEYQWLSPSL